jgi:hypothetical protein
MIGATFDTGALIALERRDLGMVIKLRVLHQAGVPITIPANAVVEWWRKGHGQSAILEFGTVEPTAANSLPGGCGNYPSLIAPGRAFSWPAQPPRFETLELGRTGLHDRICESVVRKPRGSMSAAAALQSL